MNYEKGMFNKGKGNNLKSICDFTSQKRSVALCLDSKYHNGR